MKPGKPVIRDCTSCGQLIRQRTLLSGNTIGALFWTDGKMRATMLPHFPLLIRCPQCRELLWLKNLPESEVQEEVYDTKPEIKDPFQATANDYLEAANGNLTGDSANENYLRVMAWQAVNDAVRDDNDGVEREFSPEIEANLEILLARLDIDKPEERIMKAEICRELGRFGESLQLLEFRFEEKLLKVVNLIRILAKGKKRRVAALNPPQNPAPEELSR